MLSGHETTLRFGGVRAAILVLGLSLGCALMAGCGGTCSDDEQSYYDLTLQVYEMCSPIDVDPGDLDTCEKFITAAKEAFYAVLDLTESVPGQPQTFQEFLDEALPLLEERVESGTCE